MRRRSRKLVLFGISFLDVAFCALGAVLLLLIHSMEAAHETIAEYDRLLVGLMDTVDDAQEQAERVRTELTRTHGDLELARGELTRTRGDLELARGELTRARGEADTIGSELEAARADKAGLQRRVAAFEEQIAQLEVQFQKRINGVIGLKGDFQGVAFIFDTSESMAGESWEEYKSLLTTWVLSMDYEHFTVIRFSSDAETCFPDSLVPATPENRAKAESFIQSFEPKSTTNTMAALQMALRLDHVDTIILFSDGEPNWENGRRVESTTAIANIHNWLEANNPGVAINTIAMGSYLEDRLFGRFLQKMAQDNSGTFIGR